jgi:hypothetical protein
MEVVPYPAQTVHLWLARHTPEWMFVICHPGLEKAGAEDPYFMFRVFPDRARFGEPDWFVHEDIEGNWGVPDVVHIHRVENLAHILAFISLVRIDQSGIPFSHDRLVYLFALLQMLAARIDALQECIDSWDRPFVATDTWHLVRALARQYEEEFTGTRTTHLATT